MSTPSKYPSKAAARKAKRQRRAARRARRKMSIAAPSRKRMRRRANIMPVVSGLGGYYDSDRNYRRGFAPDFGSRVGSLAGEGLQSLAEFIGLGDYKVKSNSIVDQFSGTDPPSIHNYGKGDATVIRHREYVADLITGSLVTGTNYTEYAILPLNINPGNSSMFKWLAPIAAQYQFYKMNGMVVELKSTSSTFAQDMALGSMFIATDYNASAALPQNKSDLLNMEFSTSTAPYCSNFHPIECAPSASRQDKLFVAIDNEYNGQSEVLYNWGQTFIGSEGCPVAKTKIAEIWITYEVYLYRPTTSKTHVALESALFSSGPVSTTAPFGSTPLIPDANSSSLYSLDLVGATLNIGLPNRIGSYFILGTMYNSSGPTLGWGITAINVNNCVLEPVLPTVNSPTGGLFIDETSSAVVTQNNSTFGFFVTQRELLEAGEFANVQVIGVLVPSNPSSDSYFRLFITGVESDLVSSLTLMSRNRRKLLKDPVAYQEFCNFLCEKDAAALRIAGPQSFKTRGLPAAFSGARTSY